MFGSAFKLVELIFPQVKRCKSARNTASEAIENSKIDTKPHDATSRPRIYYNACQGND